MGGMGGSNNGGWPERRRVEEGMDGGKKGWRGGKEGRFRRNDGRKGEGERWRQALKEESMDGDEGRDGCMGKKGGRERETEAGREGRMGRVRGEE